jgi:alpha-tubulin suppressor-like RCC1 family protein
LNDNENKIVPKEIKYFQNVGIPIKNIKCGSSHSFVISEYGNVYGFGYNFHGNLGLDDNTNRILPTEIKSFEKYNIISGISNHTFLYN